MKRVAAMERLGANGRLLAVAIFLVAASVHANTLRGGFVFDDLQNVVQNRWIKALGSLPEIFRSHMGGFDPEFATWYYRPLIHVAHMVVYHLAGLQPAAFHLLNVLLHAVASVLAYHITRELMRRAHPMSAGLTLIPLAIGLIFATHPVHSESVAWVSGISDLWYTVFALSALLLYVRGEEGGMTRYVLAGLLLLVATLGKEPALTLLPLLVVYEAVFRVAGPNVRRPGLLARWLPLAMATGLYLTLRVRALGGLAPRSGPSAEGPLVFTLSALDLLARYLYSLLLPVNLSAVHVFRPVDSLFDVRAVGALAVALGLAAVAWRLRGRPVAAVGLAIAVFPLLPALYIPALGEGAFGERYLYLPVLGFAMLLTQAALAVTERWPRSRSTLGVVLMLLVVAYGAGTVSRNRVWKDSLSLWSDAARKQPNSAVAHEYLCFAQYGAGRPAHALQSCRRALALDDRRIDARINLATTLSVLGDLDGAIREFHEVLRRRPTSAEAHTNLGLVYMAKGWTDLAIDSYRNALGANPHYAEAHNDLGVALAMTGRREEAIAELAAAVRLAPDMREYAANLASAGAGVPSTGGR
jgi:tetratricopeptide (TPR) repeat protein